ncbi:DAK2 domain-containing protein, partial [Cellulomonas shaoxiangyii]
LPGGAGAAEVAGTLAAGAAAAARGSSGIILSQWLVGLAAAVAAGEDLAGALTRAAAAARDAVPDPQEGTVLTVAAQVAAHVGRHDHGSAVPHGSADADVLAHALAAARSDLGRVSAGHDVLRAAHVVDAGACALLVVLDALTHALRTRTAAEVADVDLAWLPTGAVALPGAHAAAAGGAFEVMLLVRPGPSCSSTDGAAGTDALAAALRGVGDAVAVVAAGDRWHAHVHTDDPAAALALVPPGARDRVVVRAVDPGPVTGPGLVVVTASGGLAAWYATAGAVALVADPGAPVPAEHVGRAVVDAEGSHVVVLDAVGGVPPGTVPEAPGVPPATVLAAAPDGAAVVACLAVLADPARGSGAARAALDRLLSVRVPAHAPGDAGGDAPGGVPALVGAVRDLVRSRPAAQSVTLVHGADVGADAAAAVDAVRAALPDHEVVVAGPAAEAGWWVGVD